MADAKAETMVTVRIRGTMRVRYDQTRMMTRAEYEHMEALTRDAEDDWGEALAAEVESALDLTNIADGEPLEDVEIDLIHVSPPSEGAPSEGGKER